MWKRWASQRHTIMQTWFTALFVLLNLKHSMRSQWCSFSKRAGMMTISMQSTFPTVYGSFPVGSVHSNVGTCPLFLDLVIYLISAWLIIKKKSHFSFSFFLVLFFFQTCWSSSWCCLSAQNWECYLSCSLSIIDSQLSYLWSMANTGGGTHGFKEQNTPTRIF